MTDQLISFETAKLAKEKGFHTISRFGNETSLYSKKGNHVYYSNYGFMYSGLSEGYILAPTQSLLQKWLREKHNLNPYVRRSTVNGPWKCYLSTETNNSTHTWWSVDKDTYEEALEVGLQEALKFI